MFATLCNRDKMLRIYELKSCRMLEAVSLTKFGNFTYLGVDGFEITRNGNSYNVFFSVSESIEYTVPVEKVQEAEIINLNETDVTANATEVEVDLVPSVESGDESGMNATEIDLDGAALSETT